MPKWFAIFFACTDSSSVFSWKPILKVLIALEDCFCIKAVIKELSIPPDKKEPSGTSDIMWFFTEFSKANSISFFTLLLLVTSLFFSFLTIFNKFQ